MGVAARGFIIGKLKTFCHSQFVHWSCNVQSSNQMHVLLCHVCWRTHPKQLAICPICPANPYFKTVAKRWISFFLPIPNPECMLPAPSLPPNSQPCLHPLPRPWEWPGYFQLMSWILPTSPKGLRGTMLAAKVIKSMAKITVSTSRWFKSTLMNWCDSHGSSHGIKFTSDRITDAVKL